jgi:hypothetical protein
MKAEALRRISPHLPGLRAGMAERRLLMTLQSWSDECKEPPVFVLGGIVARVSQWEVFNGEWDYVLKNPPGPPMDAFHLVDARGAKALKIPHLLEVIRRNAMGCLSMAFYHEDFNAILKGKFNKEHDLMTYIAALFLFQTIEKWQEYLSLDEKMDFILDEDDAVSDAFESRWTTLYGGLPDGVKRRIAGRPTHLKDEDHPPLQGADLIAGLIHRTYKANKEGRAVNLKLWKTLCEMPNPVYRLIDREQLQGIATHWKKSNRVNNLFWEHEATALLPIMGHLVLMNNVRHLSQATAGSTIRLSSFGTSATQKGRFLLVHKCDLYGMPHLHKRHGNECLAPHGGKEQGIFRESSAAIPLKE